MVFTQIEKKHAESSLLVIVNRNRLEVAKSYNFRWGGLGIMRAYSQGILMRRLSEKNLAVCQDYVDNVYEHLEFIKKEWGKVVYLDINNLRQGVSKILNEVSRENYLEEILESLNTIKSNKNNKTMKIRFRHFLQNGSMLFQDLFKY